MAQLVRSSLVGTHRHGAIVVEGLDSGIRVIIEHDADRETVAIDLRMDHAGPLEGRRRNA